MESFLSLPPLLGHMGWGVMKLHTKDACLDIEAANGRFFFLKFSIQNSAEAAVWKRSAQRQDPTDESALDGHADASISQSKPCFDRSPVCTLSAGYITGTLLTFGGFIFYLFLILRRPGFVNQCMRTCLLGKGRKTLDKKTTLTVVEVACEALGTFFLFSRLCYVICVFC